MTVPTVERGLCETPFWSMEMAGRQALDVVDIGLFHEAEELAGVGRERLNVTALALGVDGVKGEGTFAGAGDAGDDDELIAWDGHVNVLEAVLTRALDVND